MQAKKKVNQWWENIPVAIAEFECARFMSRPQGIDHY